MSDPSNVLQPAIMAFVRADAGVAAAFGSNRVKVYDMPPTNGVEPYVVLGADDVAPDLADAIDAAEVDVTVHVWSRSDPPGKAEAQAIGAALVAALAPLEGVPALTLAGYRLTSALFVRAQYLMDVVKPLTAHGVVVIRFRVEPV